MKETETGTVKAEGVKIVTGADSATVIQSKFTRMRKGGIIQSVPNKEVKAFEKQGFVIV